MVTTGAGAALSEAAFAVALSALIASPMAAFPQYYPDNINECGRNGICVPYYSEEKLKKWAEENPSDGHLIKMVSEPDQMSSAPPVSGAQSTPTAQPPEDPNKPKDAPKVGIKTLSKRAGLPTQGRIRYVPPKNVNVNEGLPRDSQGSYKDRFGNIWRRPRGQIVGERHWDVQLSPTGKKQLGWASQSGNHINVSDDGRIVH